MYYHRAAMEASSLGTDTLKNEDRSQKLNILSGLPVLSMYSTFRNDVRPEEGIIGLFFLEKEG